MSEKQKMCTVMDLPTSILASLFAALMFTGIHDQFPLLTMAGVIRRSKENAAIPFPCNFHTIFFIIDVTQHKCLLLNTLYRKTIKNS